MWSRFIYRLSFAMKFLKCNLLDPELSGWSSQSQNTFKDSEHKLTMLADEKYYQIFVSLKHYSSYDCLYLQRKRMIVTSWERRVFQRVCSAISKVAFSPKKYLSSYIRIWHTSSGQVTRLLQNQFRFYDDGISIPS